MHILIAARRGPEYGRPMRIGMIIAVLGGVVLGAWLALQAFQRRWTRQQQAQAETTHPILLLQQQVGALQTQMQTSLDAQGKGVQDQVRELQQQVAQVLERQAQTMERTSQGLNTRMDAAARVIAGVQGELSKVAERMHAVGELKDILRAPKLRGGFGEIFLGDLLAQILPREHFIMQYGFLNGKKVDAVITLGEKLVPIDSKFPLENFQKGMAAADPEAEAAKAARRQFLVDVRRHIEAVASYIVPDERTYDFALMYIPAENIYYEVAVKSEWGNDERHLLSYALSRKVIPVSPNTLYAYLHTIALGLRGLQVEKFAQEIIGQLGRVQKDFRQLTEDFSVVGKHLTNARGAYDKVEKRLVTIDSKLESFTAAEAAKALPPA